jgi:hypothetical protein
MKLYYIEITVENGIDYECCNVLKIDAIKNRIMFEDEDLCEYEYACNVCGINIIYKSFHGFGFFVYYCDKKMTNRYIKQMKKMTAKQIDDEIKELKMEKSTIRKIRCNIKWEKNK